MGCMYKENIYTIEWCTEKKRTENLRFHLKFKINVFKIKTQQNPNEIYVQGNYL